jgi:hypothetical protein
MKQWSFSIDKVDKEHLYRIAYDKTGIAGLWTGEYRIPKRGECYIDDKELIVYEAMCDMLSFRHIAKIVKIQQHVHYTIEGEE